MKGHQSEQVLSLVSLPNNQHRPVCQKKALTGEILEMQNPGAVIIVCYKILQNLSAPPGKRSEDDRL